MIGLRISATIPLLCHLFSPDTTDSFPFVPSPTRLTSTAAFTSTLPTDTIANAKDNVLDVANELYEESKTGVFITSSSAKKKLKKVVSELEAVCDVPDEMTRKLMVGEWKLVCTTKFPATDTKFPFGEIEEGELFGLKIPDPPEFISKAQRTLRESVEVTQKIRSFEWDKNDEDNETYVTGTGKMTSKFNRVDNVIEFTPFTLDKLADITLNINPLEVSKSKVTLAHKAEVQSITPVLRTKIALKSVILTVAGESQYLEPNGADVLALQVPLGDVLNSGNFDTTYVDDDLRISRGKIGLIEQLRVFVRKPAVVEVISDEEDAEAIDESTTDDIIENVEVADEDVEETNEKDEDAEAIDDSITDDIIENVEVADEDVEETNEKDADANDQADDIVAKIEEKLKEDDGDNEDSV